MKKSNKNRKNSRSVRENSQSLNSLVLRTQIANTPFDVEQINSGTGLLTTRDGNLTSTCANAFALDPFTVGGRLYQLGSLFSEYKVHKADLTFHPLAGSNGGIDTGNGTPTSANANRMFALSGGPDPGIRTSNLSGDIAAGGKIFHTSRASSMRLGVDSSWRFTSSAAASPTEIDQRQSCFGVLNGHWREASTAASYPYGTLVLVLDVSFRGLIAYGNPVGLAIREKNDESESKRPDALSLDPRVSGSALSTVRVSRW